MKILSLSGETWSEVSWKLVIADYLLVLWQYMVWDLIRTGLGHTGPPVTKETDQCG